MQTYIKRLTVSLKRAFAVTLLIAALILFLYGHNPPQYFIDTHGTVEAAKTVATWSSMTLASVSGIVFATT